MRHQRTCDNFYTNLYKSANSEIPDINLNNLNLQNKKSLQKRSSLNSKNIKFICKAHNSNFYKYCLTCKEDICPLCNNNSHFTHDTIKYQDISLNDKQIKLLKREYNEYNNIFSNLLLKIKQWQNTLNSAILELEEYLKKKVIEIIKIMINNYNINEINYNTIIEYRLIYSLLLDDNDEKINNQNMIKKLKSCINLINYGKYQYIDENENLSFISKEIITILNNSLNQGNFFQKGNNIIKFLFNNFSLLSNESKDNKNNNIQNLGNNYIRNIKRNEKWIYSNPRMKSRLNKSTNDIFETSKSANFRQLLLDDKTPINKKNNKNQNIYERKKPCDKNKDGEIFLEKEELPKFSHKDPMQLDENDNENVNNNSTSNKKTFIKKDILYLRKKNKYLKSRNIRNNSDNKYNLTESPIFHKKEENDNFYISRGDNPLYKSNYYFHPKNSKMLNNSEDFDEFDELNMDLDYKQESNKNDSSNKRPIIFNNNINNFNNINNINSKNNFINNYNINKIYTNRNKRSKIYQHKKFNSTMYGFKSSNLMNKSQTDKNNENNEFNTIDFHTYDIYSLTNTISVVDSKSFNTNTYREKIFNSSNKKKKDKEDINNNWKIKKVSEFLIDTNKDLNIGFELGNSECKIGIINEYLNTVELWVPSENIDNNNDLSIQSLISFKDKNDNIIIGNKAEELKISNPKYSIFN